MVNKAFEFLLRSLSGKNLSSCSSWAILVASSASVRHGLNIKKNATGAKFLILVWRINTVVCPVSRGATFG